MTELDHIWSKMLIEAGEKASETGRRHVAEYLRLKATNDAIRTAGVGWLFDAVVEIATREMRGRPQMSVEREAPHSFKHGNSTMVGGLVRVSHGVRCLTVEAGWARTPSDGIMQKGALAIGRILHFGIRKQDAELRFVHSGSLPQWLDPTGRPLDASSLEAHFDQLLER